MIESVGVKMVWKGQERYVRTEMALQVPDVSICQIRVEDVAVEEEAELALKVC